MRNLFDQYDGDENRLSHALASCLDQDRRLLRSFLRRVSRARPPRNARLEVLEQSIPGEPPSADERGERGLPDVWIHDSNDWALLLESKLGAQLTAEQLGRHRRTAVRRGFARPRLLAITISKPRRLRLDGSRVRSRTWSDVYRWALGERKRSPWARHFAAYMEVVESRLTSEGTLNGGTLTQFDGIHFGEGQPYGYREAKRVLKLMMAQLRKRRALEALRMDPSREGRPAITEGPSSVVWDFIPLRAARTARNFTEFPHLTLILRPHHLSAQVTLPNAARASFRKNLVALKAEGFRRLVLDVSKGIVRATRRARGAKPEMYAVQRHHRSQRSVPTVDGEARFDPRTASARGSGRVRPQPQWIEFAYELLRKKRSNIEFGFGATVPYGVPALRSRKAVDLVAGVWMACRPLIETLLRG